MSSQPIFYQAGRGSSSIGLFYPSDISVSQDHISVPTRGSYTGNMHRLWLDSTRGIGSFPLVVARSLNTYQRLLGACCCTALRCAVICWFMPAVNRQSKTFWFAILLCGDSAWHSHASALQLWHCFHFLQRCRCHRCQCRADRAHAVCCG